MVRTYKTKSLLDRMNFICYVHGLSDQKVRLRSLICNDRRNKCNKKILTTLFSHNQVTHHDVVRGDIGREGQL